MAVTTEAALMKALDRGLELRVLVCGSRTWEDARIIGRILAGFLDEAIADFSDLIVIEGCARGADDAAHHFFDGPCNAPGGGTHAAHLRVKHMHFPADWGQYGRAAGAIRNRKMLDEGDPDFVLAFTEQPPTRGTSHMISIAKEAGKPVYVVSHG